MNNKRIYLILLIIAAVLGVIGVVYFFLWPFGGGPATQPPPLPTETPTQPFDPSRPPVREEPTGPAPDISDPAEQERQAQEALKRQALDYSARQGSYSNADSFEAIRQVYPQSTNELADFLEGQRQTLIDRYPSFGIAYGRTTRSLSAKILSGTPLLESSSATVAVQAQVVTNGANGSENISYERITITYTKQGEEWLASRIETEPLNL